MDILFSPAHLHVAINHVPIIGLSVACLPILIGILFHSRGALASGLLAVIFCAGTMPFVMETGEAAYDAFMDGSIQPNQTYHETHHTRCNCRTCVSCSHLCTPGRRDQLGFLGEKLQTAR